MGAATAELFGQEGAKVVATDIQLDALKNVTETIDDNGGTAIALEHDVTSEEAWKNVISEANQAYGEINILVNNAGVSTEKTIANMEMDEWDKIQNILLNSCVIGMKYIIPEMKKAEGGSIINMSSIAGIIGQAGTSPYTGAKGALRSLSKAAAVEYAEDYIRVNTVHPGVIETPMTSPSMETEQGMSYYKTFTQLPFFGELKDIAYGVLYLASDESKFVTGTELIIDGGWTGL